jgi:hypothetical protein
MASVGWALTLALAACGSGSSGGAAGHGGGTAGTSGSGGAAGTGGTQGTAGAGGGGAVSCGDLPACVASVVTPCPLAGPSCVEAASSTTNGITTDICFGISASSVKVVETVTSDPNTGAGTTSISVTKGGVVCFTLDGTFNSNDPPGTPQILSFKNASGTEVAKFSTDTSTFPNPTTVTCTGGQPVSVTNFGNCGRPNNPEPDQCLGGSCTAP